MGMGKKWRLDFVIWGTLQGEQVWAGSGKLKGMTGKGTGSCGLGDRVPERREENEREVREREAGNGR